MINPWNMVQRRLGWKLFLSHLTVVIVGGSMLIATAQLHASTAMVRHIARVDEAIGDDPVLKDTLRESFMSAIDETILVAATLAFLSSLAISLFVARRIVGPIQQMMRASQRIAAGEYRDRVPVTGSDELAELARSFNRMAVMMEQTEQRRLELIGNVAHELRTPLSSIQVMIEGLVDGVLLADPTTYADFQREIKRLQRLVDDLQALSRVEAGQIALKPKPEDVTPLVQSAVDRLRPQFEDKGVALDLDLATNVPLIPVDADRMMQVLINLLGNALHYTPSGGRVFVRSEWQGDCIHIQIQDTGIGIAAEHLPHIFERFYRVDKSRSRAGGGSGIGLTIAKHLIEAHGGSISVTSPGPKQGSTFTIVIPIS
jgi:signal transduction histidine kinase